MLATRILAIMVFAYALSGCGPSTEPPTSMQAAVSRSDPMEQWARSCSLCHINGIGGAPKLGDLEDWAPRLNQGDELLLAHTVQGYNNMPPLGYCMDCERADLIALIKFMSTGLQP